MVQNPPEGYQRVIPYLVYTDGAAAIEFLTRAFGFEELFRMKAEDGRVQHAELRLDDCVVMIGSGPPEMGIRPPKDLGATHCSLLVYVDDVDAHHARATAEGATVEGKPEDKFYGDRSYLAIDPEGHKWFFATHVKDVSPDELQQHAS